MDIYGDNMTTSSCVRKRMLYCPLLNVIKNQDKLPAKTQGKN